jgi:hypothetical protein
MNNMNMMNMGLQPAKDLGWTDQMCADICMAVDAEAKRTKIAAQFLPRFEISMGEMGMSERGMGMNHVARRTIQHDAVASQTASRLSIEEVDELSILEIWSEFSLTDPQFKDEAMLKTAMTLAVVAANKLSRAEDLLIFQGRDGLKDPLFTNGTVGMRNAPLNDGKLEVSNSLRFDGLLEKVPESHRIPVGATQANRDPSINRYGENTFGAVAKGYSILQRSHYGRDALALPTNAFADTWAPLKTTLIMPADRIKGLVGDRFYSTSSLPNDFDGGNIPQGVLVALDGNTMDLVMTVPPTVEYLQKSADPTTGGTHLLRVFERFALRLKDPNSVVSLEFQKEETQEGTAPRF